MPAIVGAVKVVTVSGSAVFNIGDVYMVRPMAMTKTFSGAGSFNTGAQVQTSSQFNQTQVLDSDQNDQNQLLNI